MLKTSFLVDGFNLYHSLVSAQKDLELPVKWLDLKSFCNSYLSAIRQNVGERVSLQDVYYFSALADYLQEEGKAKRHKDLIACMNDTGVIVELGKFKKKRIRCKKCGQGFNEYEEKETDVSIASKLLEICLLDKCDVAVIISGDTDLIPAVKTIHRIKPEKQIIFAMPYLRHSKELKQLCPYSFNISKEQYFNYQFDNPYKHSDGRSILKPRMWAEVKST